MNESEGGGFHGIRRGSGNGVIECFTLVISVPDFLEQGMVRHIRLGFRVAINEQDGFLTCGEGDYIWFLESKDVTAHGEIHSAFKDVPHGTFNNSSDLSGLSFLCGEDNLLTYHLVNNIAVVIQLAGQYQHDIPPCLQYTPQLLFISNKKDGLPIRATRLTFVRATRRLIQSQIL